MKTKSTLAIVQAISCTLLAALWCEQSRAQDLPFTSASTGADGPLQFVSLAPGPNSGRYGHALAYDAARQQTVLFGGYASGSRNDTWVFNGTNWTQLSPTANPSARQQHAMVYDSARQQVVLFGGYSSGGSYLSDTWIFDGTNWAQLSPATNPPARQGHAMAYDSARQQVVLFGGTSSFSGRNDTWAFDGTNWLQLGPTTSPSTRYLHAMAYDAANQRTVLFGGYSSSSDTWVFNGTNWSQLNPTPRPPGRSQHAVAYDVARQQVVLFGGSTGSSSYYNDTWLLAGTNWFFSSDTAQYPFDMRSKPDGVWDFTSIDIPGGAMIRVIKNAANTPLVWLATSNVTINGTLDLSGQDGLAPGGNNQLSGNEAQGGPGGFVGGLGGVRFDQSGSYAGTPGQGPGGGLPGVTNSQVGVRGTHVSTYGNAYLQPLIGGSGGGGRGSSATANGGNGGGGGGAIYISSSRDIVVNGSVHANGGSGSSSAGGGSGGDIRLQADRIVGNGSLQATGSGFSLAGESGRIRLEAFLRTFNGTSSGTIVSSSPVSNANFTVTGNLLITSVAGQNVVQPPGGSTQNPDVIFTATGPVNVTATSTNIPDGIPVVLRVTSSGQIIQATNNLASGIATFDVTVPAGVGTIQASATYTLGN